MPPIYFSLNPCWNRVMPSVTSKKSPNAYKNCPKMIPLETGNILTSLQRLPKMLAIWAKKLLPQALKSCPKCNKLSNLITLVIPPRHGLTWEMDPPSLPRTLKLGLIYLFPSSLLKLKAFSVYPVFWFREKGMIGNNWYYIYNTKYIDKVI